MDEYLVELKVQKKNEVEESQMESRQQAAGYNTCVDSESGSGSGRKLVYGSMERTVQKQ